VASIRGSRLSLGAEAALAFATGIAAFAIVSFAVIIGNSDGLVLLTIALCAAAATTIFRFWGVAYAVPAVLAAILALDWFYIPPTHPHSFPDAESLAFTELAATAIANTQSRNQTRRLADEQAALRRAPLGR
jgi:hypothetical protein